uniref:Uncharacterized protein LOC104249069 n=1 Tax=Nicotiana sylvestris TaxID=4096 RepID=A0A1U7YX43_NICSY|nr:PREDICTED: uncharacterized protein LOC104249069 [Nicotiana sylvestris]
MEIKSREDLIKALVTFWDPIHNVFHFPEFELSPTLEEMAGYIEFGHDSRKQQLIFSRAPSVHKFFDLLNISKQMKKAHVNEGCCSFHFLYFRFGHSAGFETHEKGLNNKQDKGIWQIHHRFAFIVVFLGIMVFPNSEGTVDIRMARIAQILTTNKDHTLASLVLADIYRALTLCKAEAQFFEDNFIKSYKERVKDYNAQEGFEA